MKRVLVLATLLMVGCGGNHSENKTAEEGGVKKVSAQMADGKRLPEMQMIKPQSAPISIKAITADKDAEYIKSRNLPIEIKEK